MDEALLDENADFEIENCEESMAGRTNVRRKREAAPVLPLGLDRIDRGILRWLQRDASVSNVALAQKVHLSPAACLRRVERLKEMGLVRRVVALLDPVPLGLGMLVVIGVVLDRSTPDSFANFEKAVQKVPGCLDCVVVTGEFDYFVTVRTQNNESFNRLHAAELLYLPGVRQIRTFVVLKQVLSTTELPIAP
jgi:DNA-binding Lrp family transcriptional regulator